MVSIKKRILIGGLVLIALFIGLSSAQECNCTTCDSCETSLNSSSCSTVFLTENITNQTGTCINDPDSFNNKTFNCQGNIICGNSTLSSYGIYLDTKYDNTINDCKICNFETGIHLRYSSNNTVLDSTSWNNTYYGLYILSASNNTLLRNTFYNNLQEGIRFWTAKSNFVYNNLLINNTLGIYLTDHSKNNTFFNNTLENNSEIGLRFTASSGNNTVTQNTICYNTNYDIYNNPFDNFGFNNTCNVTGGLGNSDWNDTGVSTGCTYLCGYAGLSNISIILNYGWNLISIPLEYS